MKTYRRIEVNAYRRRVTIVSGEWSGEIEPAETDDGVSLNDADLAQPVAPDSPEGQLILAEAVRSLERRLSPEARAMIRAGVNAPISDGSKPTSVYLRLRSFFESIGPKALRFARKER